MELLKEVNDLNVVYTSAAQINERYQELFKYGYSDLTIKEKDMIISTVIEYLDKDCYITGANLKEAIDAFYLAKKNLELEKI